MKKIQWKKYVFLLMIICAMQQTHAETPQPQQEFLLPNLQHDSLTTTAISTKEVVAIPLQSSVRKFTDDYLDEHGQMLATIKENNGKTFTIIQKILLNRGVPPQMMYLAVVESKLKIKATSGAGAGGVWQLMPVTARSLGLRVNGKTDERRSIYQSSVAAADYLHELYQQFDDWLLVVAAYNCGAGNVYKAIKQSGSREFWKLQSFLPLETRNHVKRFIATHYYYEEQGSLVTLTKKERIKHLAAVNEMLAKEEKPQTGIISTQHQQFYNCILVASYEGEMIFELRK
jgi:membrane-bound lytic murein transglycosylase D